ncbi:MAG: T9SS type A sorting domain-containing protein [Bacteroidia bacterium]
MINKLTLIILFLYSCFLQGQRANTWHFGNGAGLSFSSAPPTALSGGQTGGPDNRSSISDTQGNLLFYTDGVTVWNKNHSQMPNGFGLTGHISAGQCALILPYPCNDNKYIIFHVTEYSSPGYLSYTIVDMTLNNGFGDVVTTQKNVSLGTGWTEKLCAYYNASSNFYWLFSHKWNSNQFVGFKIDASGIATQSVVSSVGSILNCGSYGGTHDAMGQLTISPDGSKIANALTCQDQFEVFDLNISTGIVSNAMLLPGAGNAWGVAFSPDSKKIYVDGLFGQTIYQFDLSSGNQSTIISTQYPVYTASNSGYNFGYMEMGPDSLVYIAKPGSNSLTVISNPNNSGAACNFSLAGPSLGSQTSSHGLSRIAYNIPTGTGSSPGTPTVNIIYPAATAILCMGQSTTLTATGATTYTWNSGLTTSSVLITPTVTTTYSVTGGINSCSGLAAITVSVTDCTSLNSATNENKEIIIFPNPADDYLNLIIKDNFDYSVIELFGETGQLIRKIPAKKQDAKIDVSDLPNGFYFLKITANEKTIALKFLKN